MSNPLRAPRGTTSSISTRALLAGELAYDTDTERLRVGDGTTLGGRMVGPGDSLSWVNVQDASYGAVGDGSTDDTTAFAAAMLIGGDIYVPDGTYVVSTMALSVAGTRLFGGPGAVLKFKNSTANTEMIRLTAARCAVEGLTVNGNKSGVTYSYNYGTIAIYAADCRVEGVRLYDAQSMGILMGEGGVRPILRGNKITDAGDFPIFANDSGASVKPAKGLCVNNQIIGWGSSGTASAGIGIRGTDWRVETNYVEQTAVQSLEQLCIEVWTGGDRATVVGNVCLPLTYAEMGISMAAPNTTCVGNIVKGSTSYGIEIAASAAVLVSGNTVLDATGAGISVNIAASQECDYSAVVGNSVYNCTGSGAGVAAIAVTGSGATADHVLIANNSVNGTAAGIYAQNFANIEIVDNTVVVGVSTGLGITTVGNKAKISGNKVTLTTGATHASGIAVSGDDCVISDNWVDGASATTNVILVNATYARVFVHGNYVLNASSNAILVNSTEATVFVYDNETNGGAVSVQTNTVTWGNIVAGTTAAWANKWPVHICSALATPAGGTAGQGLRFGTTSNFGVFFGSGAPSLQAAQGSIYLRSDGSSTSTRAYINTDGGTTWTTVTTAT